MEMQATSADRNLLLEFRGELDHHGARNALREAIDALPEKERMTILLRYFKGMTQEQTARVLGVSQVQISRLERRGLKRLRESVGP